MIYLGYYPIHEAAKNASANTLEAILEWGIIYRAVQTSN
jgi:hypothetical protein